MRVIKDFTLYFALLKQRKYPKYCSCSKCSQYGQCEFRMLMDVEC